MAGNGREVLVATAPAGLERSADGGQTFSTVPLEVPARAAWSSPGSEPAPYVSSVLASDGRIVVGVNRGGVLISADGGRSFRDVTGDVAPGVLALASAGPSLLVATADGLFAGDAAGNSFSLLFRPPQREAVTAVATAPSHPLRLILGASRAVSLAKPGVPAGCDSRIYRSVNAGASFTEIGRELLPVVRGYFTSFVFAPRDPDRLFAGTSSGEIFESRDGGVSFHLIVSTLPSVLSLSLGPAFFS